MTTSLSNSHRYRAADGQPGSVVWFISFGDLLTLLLCFFLVLTPWDRLKEGKNTESLRAASARMDGEHRHGTTFASDLPLRGSPVVREFPIFSQELSEGDEWMFELIAKELKARELSIGRIEVLVCSPADDRARIVRGVGEALRRGERSDVPVRFHVTRECEAGDVLAPVTEAYVGRVRVLGTL